MKTPKPKKKKPATAPQLIARIQALSSRRVIADREIRGPRETQVMIRLTEDEREELETQAAAEGRPLASWVRHHVLKLARELAKAER